MMKSEPTFIDLTTKGGTISFEGTAILVHEVSGWWVFGVMPGGVAEHGNDPDRAIGEFRKTLHEIVMNIMHDTYPIDQRLDTVRRAAEQVDYNEAERFREGSKLGQLAFRYKFSCREC